jgi:hypothetical protein
MNSKILKISSSLMAVGIMAPTILFTTNEAKAYEQNQQEIQQASEQLQKMGEGALEGLHQNKEAFQKAGVYDKMERDAQQLANGQSERGKKKATLGAKAGAKAIKATAKKVGQKAWDGYIKQVEKKRAGVKVAFLHYQSIFKFCDYITGFGGTVTDAISKGLQNKLGFNKTLAYYIAKAFVLIVL